VNFSIWKIAFLAGLVLVLIASLMTPVLATNYVSGLSEGDYVKLDNWYSIGVVPEHVVSWQKIDVQSAVGNVITWQMTGEMNISSIPFPNNGEIYDVNAETGATNYTHSTLGPIIAANLNEGDHISRNVDSLKISKTEIRNYLEVSRPVNIVISTSTGEGDKGNYTIQGTFIYDKASGMMLETDNRIWWSNATLPDHLVYMSVNETNIFSPAPKQQSIPAIIAYPAIATAIITPIGATAIVLRRRKQSKAKPTIVETEKTDSVYSLAGVNRGECYLTDSLEHCARIVCDLHSRGVSALVIVREDPVFLTKTCNLEPENLILLSSKPIGGFKAINTLQEISISIMKFVKAGGGVVLLDGLEYLISRFGFNTVYMMLQEKKIEFLEARAVLLVPVNLESLENREKGQLLSELKLL
jgi:hypothetical protein